jgi:hypothetical protein
MPSNHRKAFRHSSFIRTKIARNTQEIIWCCDGLAIALDNGVREQPSFWGETMPTIQGEREIEPRDSRSKRDAAPASPSFGTIDGDGLSSEQRLMLAVLVDAINILKGRVPTGGWSKRQAFAEAAHWVAMRGTHYPFTFDSVCAALNLPEEKLREYLSRLARDRGETHGAARLRRQQMSRVRTAQLK